MDELFADLDDAARLALDVALGTAAALGDSQCGTEYLLFGIFATARGEMAEVGELFVLHELRIERAIQKLRDGNFNGAEYDGDPPLSRRACVASRSMLFTNSTRGRPANLATLKPSLESPSMNSYTGCRRACRR